MLTRDTFKVLSSLFFKAKCNDKVTDNWHKAQIVFMVKICVSVCVCTAVSEHAVEARALELAEDVLECEYRERQQAMHVMAVHSLQQEQGQLPPSSRHIFPLWHHIYLHTTVSRRPSAEKTSTGTNFSYDVEMVLMPKRLKSLSAAHRLLPAWGHC